MYRGSKKKQHAEHVFLEGFQHKNCQADMDDDNASFSNSEKWARNLHAMYSLYCSFFFFVTKLIYEREIMFCKPEPEKLLFRENCNVFQNIQLKLLKRHKI